MPPKKRAVRSSPVTNKVKRQKAVNNADNASIADQAVDLTAQNAVDSALLCLPAELRNAIWEFAFGNKMICIDAHRRLVDSEDLTTLQYTIYDAVCDYPRGSQAWLSEMTVTPAPQLVCRQYWTETSQAFLASCTFRVDSPIAFRALALSEQPIVLQLRRLMIHSSGSKSHNFPMYWQDVFNSSLVGRLVSLEGLRFSGVVYWGPGSGHRTTDVMEGSHWKMIKLSTTIRSFQQHKLKKELTVVTIEPYCYAHEPPWVAGPINEAIRKSLLQHHPRRRSKRGS